MAQNCIWLYEPSIKTQPQFVVQAGMLSRVQLWLHERDLTHNLQTEGDLTFTFTQDMLLFRITFNEDIVMWGGKK